MTAIAQPSGGPLEYGPCDTVNEYHDLLNNDEYVRAWSLLSERFKTTPSVGAYFGWEGFWKVTTVNLLEVVPQSEAKAEARCTVRLQYVEAGEERTFTYYLVRDDVGDTWLIDAVGVAP
ncbi:MAG: hypothetical protein NTU91_07605 [Chloroflexi bacterium]|nr:hypothetical protein [Chloroflexota bacterium]